MTNTQKVKMVLAYIGMSEAELARRLGSSPQVFHRRMKTDKLSTNDLLKIAEIVGATYTHAFEFTDGTKV
ncbi:transcriptional regulator [Clostridia bacterium]|nr:transcriptional regulator [Clostridia bacterium]